MSWLILYEELAVVFCLFIYLCLLSLLLVILFPHVSQFILQYELSQYAFPCLLYFYFASYIDIQMLKIKYHAISQIAIMLVNRQVLAWLMLLYKR